MKTEAVTGIVLTMLLLVVVSPIGVSVRVVDSDSESGDFVAQSSVDWWPMFRHDPKHTGRSPVVGAQQASLEWTFYTGGAIRSSPAIAPDGTIYVGSDNHKIYAINPDGTPKWNYTTGGAVYSSPAIGSDGTIYVGSYDYKVYAINPDGTLKWTYTTIAEVTSSPAIDPSSGVIYVAATYDASWHGRMYAFYPNGTLKWVFNPGTSGCWIASSPAIREDGVILFGDYTNPKGIFWALNPDGTVLWSKAIPCPFEEIDISSSAAIDSDGMIYFGGSNTNLDLWALYPNGTIAWSYRTGGLVWGSPAIDIDGTIYIGSYDGKLYAINPNGTSKWAYATGAAIRESSSAIGADGTIYVGSEDGKIYAINPDGTPKWSYTTGGAVRSSPAIGSDGTIYVGSSDGKLYAFGLPPDYKLLTITATTGGTTNPPPRLYAYVADSSVEVTAIPDTYFDLDHWELDGSWNYSNPISVTMDSDHTLHAVFNYDVTIEAHCYTEGVDVSVSITRDGSPTPETTPHTFTGLTGTHNFTVPNTDPNSHLFKQWSTGETSTTITVNAGGTYTAYYQAKYNLTITTTPGGTTNPAPGTYTYWEGTTVSVEALPSLGYLLDYWKLDGANIGAPNPISVTMNANHTLHAVFLWVGTYNLTIITTCGGTTNPAPRTYTYTMGTVVSVTATEGPDIRYAFGHWVLDGSWNYSNPIIVYMDSDHILYAVFKSSFTPMGRHGPPLLS